MNRTLFNLLSNAEFSLKTVRDITTLLYRSRTLYFPAFDNGLFAAADLQGESFQYTGYGNVWVRDNIFIAYAHYVQGEHDTAVKTVKTLASYFYQHRKRFEKIIAGELNHQIPMNRPHIRFGGKTLSELDETWAHAQNDALGYFLWFFCKLVNNGCLIPTESEKMLVGLFPAYFQTVQYWQDEDNGHWEEDRKIEASSIGAVIAGLKELKRCVQKEGLEQPDVGLLNDLISQGQSALTDILPYECRQAPPHERRYDAALLFLIYPLQVVTGQMADRIVADVVKHLKGDVGIRRYLGDTFWCRNYKDVPETIRTGICSERELWLKDQDWDLQPGEEAQWCIFDPIVSIIFGQKYLAEGHHDDLEQQTVYLIRSLGQITGEESAVGAFKCPELYYLENGRYVANDSTPLLWTQANLWLALHCMEESLIK